MVLKKVIELYSFIKKYYYSKIFKFIKDGVKILKMQYCQLALEIYCNVHSAIQTNLARHHPVCILLGILLSKDW